MLSVRVCKEEKQLPQSDASLEVPIRMPLISNLSRRNTVHQWSNRGEAWMQAMLEDCMLHYNDLMNQPDAGGERP